MIPLFSSYNEPLKITEFLESMRGHSISYGK